MTMRHLSIESLCTRVASGGTPSRSNEGYWVGGNIPWLKTGELNDARISDAEEKITEEALANSSAKIFPENTVLMAMYGDGKTITTLGVLDAPCATNQACAAMIANPEKCDHSYLFYALKKERHKFLKLVVAGAQRNLSLGIIKRFEIPAPELEVQKRIASVLSAYDDLIENNQRRIALLEKATRLLYREWFVHFRFPGHEHVKIVNGVPEGWEIVSMEDVCTRITDGSHSSPKSVDDGYPMASVKDMHDWGIDTINCRQISHDDYEKLVRADCKPLLNDVLIAKDGSYLKHCFVVQEEIDLVILSSIAILRPNNRIDPHLLNFILRDPMTKERMKGYVSGAALPRIILKEFRNFKILLPNDEAQRLWADNAHPIAKQCETLIRTNHQLAKARDLLLPRLMDGRLEV